MNRKIKILEIGIIFFAIFCTLPINAPVSSPAYGIKENVQSSRITDGNNSFHGTTFGMNSNCYIIKLYSNETIYISEIYVNQFYFSGNRTRWGDTNCIYLTNLTKTFHISYWGWSPNPSDFYLQADTAFINFKYNHLLERKGFNNTYRAKIWNISFPAGTWYLVFWVAPTEKCRIEVYINETNAEIIGVTEGSSSFIYENEDFYSKLNLKSLPFSLILDGKKTIEINHTFMGSFLPLMWGKGVVKMKYTSPEGIIKKATVVFMSKGKYYLKEGSDFDPFLDVITGGAGKWKFEVDMVGIFCPVINIFGVDAVLPS